MTISRANLRKKLRTVLYVVGEVNCSTFLSRVEVRIPFPLKGEKGDAKEAFARREIVCNKQDLEFQRKSE